MRKLIVVIACMILAYGCGETKRIDGHTYDTYGIFNKAEVRNPDIEYRLITGNVVWGVVLVGTIAAPVYFFGFSLYEPVQKSHGKKPKGAL